MTGEEFYAKINRAKQPEAGKKIKLTSELEKELFESFLKNLMLNPK